MNLSLKNAAYAVLAILSALSIIIVKFAVSENHNKKIKKNQNSQNIYSCKQVFMFLTKRFTFLEILIIRKARFKLSQNLSFAIHLIIAFIFQNGYFWSWLITILICIALFIITEIYIERRNSTVEQQNSSQQITQQICLRKMVIYGIYGLISVLIYLTFSYLFYYSTINFTFLSKTFLPALAVDQFLGRPIFFIFVSFLLNQSPSLIFLMETYNQIQKVSQQEKKISNNSAILPASPQHKNKQLKRLSPSKIPKAIDRFEIQDNFAIEPRPTINNPTFEIDSLINFFEQSHKKKLENTKINLSANYNEGITPKKKIKSQHKSLQASLEFVNNNIIIKSPNFQENKYKSPQNSEQKKNLRIITQLDKQKNQQGNCPLKNLSEIKPIQQFHENSKKRYARDLNTSKEIIESAKKSHFEFTLEDKQIEQMNTFEIQSKQSRKSVNKKQNSDNQSPKSIKTSKYNTQLQNQLNDQSNQSKSKKGRQESSYKKNSIHYIEQQPQHEQQYPQNKQFQVNSLNGSHFPLMSNTSQQYIVQNEKVYKICNENSQTQQNKHTLLEIKQQNQYEIQQLSELDINSPMKQNNIRQQSNIGNIKLKTQLSHPLPRHKKRPLHKRDLRQLRKLDSSSPYLEYLPNMLTKQIQNNKKLHQKEGEQKLKRGRSTRRQSNRPSKQLNKEIKPQQETYLNNQNACPKIYLQDF